MAWTGQQPYQYNSGFYDPYSAYNEFIPGPHGGYIPVRGHGYYHQGHYREQNISNYYPRTGNMHDTTYAPSNEWDRNEHAHKENPGRSNKRSAQKIIFVDEEEEEDSELGRFLLQFRPNDIHPNPAVGLVVASAYAHQNNSLSKEAMYELHQRLLRFLIQEKIYKVWWQVLFAYQRYDHRDNSLENCLAMGLQNIDLQALKRYCKFRFLAREKDFGPTVRDVLTQAGQVQGAIKAGWEMNL
ncbi:MAG: hypothetical protein Q9215_003436 [Flavoplaca cf. flavocitrina]